MQRKGGAEVNKGVGRTRRVRAKKRMRGGQRTAKRLRGPSEGQHESPVTGMKTGLGNRGRKCGSGAKPVVKERRREGKR